MKQQLTSLLVRTIPALLVMTCWTNLSLGQTAKPAPPKPVLVLQVGHPESASIVGFTHGDKELITSGGDGFRFWRTSDGALLRVRPVSGGRLSTAVLSPDKSQLLYMVLYNNKEYETETEMRLTETQSGRLLGVRKLDKRLSGYPQFIDGHPVAVESDPESNINIVVTRMNGSPIQHPHSGIIEYIDVLADGTIAICDLAKEGVQGKVTLWRPFSSQPPQAVNLGIDQPRGVASHPSEPLIAVAGNPGGIVEVDRTTGKQVSKYDSKVEDVRSLAYTPDGRYLVAVGSDKGEVWETATGKRISRFLRSDDSAYAVTISPDGKTCAMAGSIRDTRISRIAIWSLPDGKLTRDFPVGAQEVSDVSCSKYPHTLVSAHIWSFFCTWDLEHARLRQVRFADINSLVKATITRNGKQVIEVGRDQPAMAIYQTGEKRVSWTGNRGEGAFGDPSISPDGKQIAVAASDRILLGTGDQSPIQIHIYDVASGRLVKVLGPTPVQVFATAKYTPSGKYLVVASIYQPTVIYETKGWTLVRTIARPPKEHGGLPWSKDFAVSDSVIALKTYPHDLHVWDIKTGKHLWHKHGYFIYDSRVYIDSTSRHVILVGEKDTFAYRATDGSELKPDLREVHRTVDQAIGRNRQLGIVPGKDGSITYRDNDTGNTLVSMFVLPPKEDGKAPTDWIAYTPDGYYQGSKGVEKYVCWRVGEQVLPGSVFQKRFKRPDVVVGRLRGYLR